MKKILALAGAFCLMAVGAMAAPKYNAALVNSAGLAYNNTYPLSLNSYGIDDLSFVATATSVTFANQTFTDGTASTASITVASNTGLSSATASDFLTVLSTNIPSGATITVNGTVLTNGIQWFADVTSTNTTAISIKQAINAYVPGVVASTGPSNVVYSTAAQGGSYGNNMTMASNTSSITVNSANFTGGTDNAVLIINGIALMQGRDWFIGATSSNTAVSLSSAVTFSPLLAGIVASTTGITGAVVYATSTVVGTNTNYSLFSSSQTEIQLAGPVVISSGQATSAMTGGTNSAFAINSSTITIAGNGFVQGLAVVYTTPTVAINGLIGGTTYFIIEIPITSSGTPSFMLASSLVNANAGVAIVLTSSRTPTTTDSYTLRVSTIVGIPSYKWQVSNDGVNYADYTTNTFNVTISSVSLTSYTFGGSSTAWDFGPINYAWIRLNVIAPAFGAIKLLVTGNGKGLTQ